MIMRYQRIIPEGLNLSNGRRTTSTSNPTWKTGKEDMDREESNGHVIAKTTSTFEGKGISRFRSPSKTSQDNHIGNGAISAEAEDPNSPPTSLSKNHQNLESNGVVRGSGNDTFLQWGHKKRSRCSRGMALTDDTSSSTSTLQSTKLQRRLLPQSSSPNSNAMPPPSHSTTNGVSRGPNLRTPTKNISSSPSPVRRNLEDRSIVGNKSPPCNSGGSSRRGVSSRSRVGKKVPALDKRTPCSSSVATRDEKMNGGSSSVHHHHHHHHHQVVVTGGADTSHMVSPPHVGGCSVNDDTNHNDSNVVRVARTAAGTATAAAGGGGGPEKVNTNGGGEVNEWPRIYVPLSRKEKEEDFLAMKGTKLPHRPKKRPKTIDRLLQYCFPGMWLSDLTRGRYEVREKKCPRKQKRRGLKGMENLESDSEC